MNDLLTNYLQTNPEKNDVFQSQDVAIVLARIWQNLFDDSSLTFAYDEDFFVLGASSLLAVSLVNAIQTQFNTEFSLRQLLSATQFHQLANLIYDLQRAQDENNCAEKDEFDVVVI